MSEGTVLGIEAWRQMWASLGGSARDDLRTRILTGYDEPHRAYHTRVHLHECLEQLHSALQRAPPLEHPTSGNEIAVALWFHDVVYDPRRHDNEAVSADQARDALLAAGVTPAIADRVHGLIMATRHAVAPIAPDEQLLVDIDLAILGAAPDRFDEYEKQVREEYSWVPGFLFRRERRTILQQFVERPRIYQTASFFDALETRARTNLRRSIEQLGGEERKPGPEGPGLQC
jgi:predicted metal-dependent HD superfamily phosphohydrolase